MPLNLAVVKPIDHRNKFSDIFGIVIVVDIFGIVIVVESHIKILVNKSGDMRESWIMEKMLTYSFMSSEKYED